MKHFAWVALLPGGILLLMLARPLYQHPYDDQGFGIFYGNFRGSYIPLDGSNGSVVISGETIPEWRWARPANYKYPIIKFELNSGNSGKNGRLNLSTMQLEQENTTVTIDHRWLLESGQSEATATAYMALLNSVRDGGLPRPRHHPRKVVGDGLAGYIAHFSLGLRFPHAILIWFALWLGVTALFVCRRAKTRQATSSGWQAA